MSWLNYHHLNYFRMIATSGSIAAAAKIARISQSALSYQLKQLENSLGKTLFIRKKRQLVLTEDGRLTLDYANEIFRLGDELMHLSALGNSRDSYKRLHLGVSFGVPKSIVLSLIRKHSNSEETIRITINTGSTEQLFKELEEHRLDLVISNSPPPHGEQNSFLSKLIKTLPVSVYGAPQFRKLKDGFPDSLGGQPFVLPNLFVKLRQDIDQYFRLGQVEVNAFVEVEDTGLQKIMAVAGIGMIIIPDSVAAKYINSGSLIRIGRLGGLREQIWLSSISRKTANPIALKFLKELSADH